MAAQALGVQAQGSEELASLFREHYPSMVRLAYLLTSDRGVSEEIAQEAFVRTWRAWGRIRREGAEPAYLRATVVNLSRSSLRRRFLELRHRSAERPLPADDHAEPAVSIDLARAVRSLPPRRRACVVLRYYADLSEQETARLLGVSVGTVKSQTHKALSHLQRLLEDSGKGLPPSREG